jgi:hypothetical protein
VCAIQAHVMPPPWFEDHEVREPTMAKHRVDVVKLLLRAGADVDMRAWDSEHGISALEAALTTPYPPKDHAAPAEELSCVFVRGASRDYYTLHMLFAVRTAERDIPVHCGVTPLFSPGLQWEDELIPTLLRAGATVTRRDLDFAREVLMSIHPEQFFG